MTEKNSILAATSRTQSRGIVLPGLERVRKMSRSDKTKRFTSLLHHISPEILKQSYHGLKRYAAPGIDGVTWNEYGLQLETNIQKLYGKIHSGKYRATASKQKVIPKQDGGQRQLGIASLEDKIAQKAVATILNGIYEEDFLGFSYGFRPKKSAHDALDALNVGINRKKINWILDADIQGFFDNIDHEWMSKMLAHRIADKRILRLVNKWLKAGVTEQGKWRRTEKGCPQGSVISPLLANIYLHYVLDVWIQAYRTRKAKGDIIYVRYGDDYILGFQYKHEANEVMHMLKDRLAKFKLRLHPAKTKLIRFGRFAIKQRETLSEGKPETFDFLGFKHICTRTKKQGLLAVKRITIKERMRKKLQSIKETLLKCRHEPIVKQGEWLNRVVRGYFNYHAVPGNLKTLSSFRREVTRYWLRALRRRSQRHRLTWNKFKVLIGTFIPKLKLVHDFPYKRFDAKILSKSRMH